MAGDNKYDVAIIGAGPAGATAAALLARAGRNIALIERQKERRCVLCAGWLSSRASDILAELACSMPAEAMTPFSQVTFFNADCTKRASPKLEGTVGYLVDRERFDTTLTEHAASLGASVLAGEEATDIQLSENQVVVKRAGSTVQSRLLVLATGRGSPLPGRAGFAQRASDAATWVAQVEAKHDGSPSEPHVAVILGLDTRGSFGFCGVAPSRVTLSVNFAGDPGPATAALGRLCKVLLEQGVLPRDLSGEALKVRPLRCPAGWALDMETHVAKHTLVIGEAGGFVAASSNEGLYPSMWSARIAAGVIDQALKSPYSQDELMNFDSQWRMQLADHLRSPHTDVRFLLPLIFSNQAMADRMAAAFFFGENI